VKVVKLPVELLAKTRRLVSEFAMGETGYVGLREKWTRRLDERLAT